MTKQDDLIEALKAGWCSATHLQAVMHWKNDTLRGAISNLGRKRWLAVEHRREAGITEYRIAPESEKQ